MQSYCRGRKVTVNHAFLQRHMGLVKSVTSCSDGLFHGPGTGFGREGLRGIIYGATCQEYLASHRQTMRVGSEEETE